MPFRNRLPECVDYGTRGCAGVVIKSENLFCRKDEWVRNGGKKGAVRQMPARVFKLRPLERRDPCVGSLADLQNLWSRRLLR